MTVSSMARDARGRRLVSRALLAAPIDGVAVIVQLRHRVRVHGAAGLTARALALRHADVPYGPVEVHRGCVPMHLGAEVAPAAAHVQHRAEEELGCQFAETHPLSY